MFVDNTHAAHGAGSQQGSQAASQKALQDKEQFLALLVAQISHQDPMNPVDDKDMVGQLAQFSAIEQQIETNQNLSGLRQDFATSSRVSMASLIGKQAGATLRGVEIAEGAGVQPVSVFLESPAQDVTVRIVDQENNLVRSLHPGALGAGMHALNWDGMGNNHTQVPAGHYRTVIEAKDGQGQPLTVKNQLFGTIESIDIDSREPAVYIHGARVNLDELTEVRQ